MRVSLDRTMVRCLTYILQASVRVEEELVYDRPDEAEAALSHVLQIIWQGQLNLNLGGIRRRIGEWLTELPDFDNPGGTMLEVA